MHNAFLIDTTSAAPITHDLTLEALQATVGGYIECAFNIPSPARKGYTLTGYVNDEGLLQRLPVCVVASTCGPLAGPVIVCGLDWRTGETVPLIEEELEWLAKRVVLLGAGGIGGKILSAVHWLDTLDTDPDDE